MDDAYVLAAVVIAAAVTWALRAVPFAALSGLRGNGLVDYLGDRTPVGILFILVAYTLKDTPVELGGPALAVICGLAVTVALHLWRENLVLSVFAGTAVHTLIASLTA